LVSMLRLIYFRAYGDITRIIIAIGLSALCYDGV
jgi:hypothetical protein